MSAVTIAKEGRDPSYTFLHLGDGGRQFSLRIVRRASRIPPLTDFIQLAFNPDQALMN